MIRVKQVFVLGLFFLLINNQAYSIENEDILGELLLKKQYKGVTQSYNVFYSIKNGWHPGIDYRAAIGTAVYSPVSGVIHGIDITEKGFGRLSVKVDGTNDYFIFLHLSSILPNIKQSSYINAGSVIGKSGKTGTSAPHLHVELRTGRSLASPYFAAKKNTGVNKNPTEVLAYASQKKLTSITVLVGSCICGNHMASFQGDYKSKKIDVSLYYGGDTEFVVKGQVKKKWFELFCPNMSDDYGPLSGKIVKLEGSWDGAYDGMMIFSAKRVYLLE